MKSRKTRFRRVVQSLQDLVGKDYIGAVCAALDALGVMNVAEARSLATEKIEFFPDDFHRRLLGFLRQTGQVVSKPLRKTISGAASEQFSVSTKMGSSPIGTLGYFRVGEDGRLFFTAKSEHYHVSLGHGFPGYRLVNHARKLGIPNATHNNTRGYITRLLERELVRTAAGLAAKNPSELDRIINSKRKGVLNRVLNLETGSLAVEAALKMILSRFYKIQADGPEPRYSGKTPVLLVMGDDRGGLQANYHGTTVLTQIMRGMWPGLYEQLEKSRLLLVRCVCPNDYEGLEAAFQRYEKGHYKIAGFFHELVLMNYGARLLEEKFVRRAYALCKKHDVPTVVDEIQSCIWSPELFMFREYGIKPDFLAVGKGIPGGEFAASRILFNAQMDKLPLFGALVTNGQEELASLSYLVTMRWAETNAAVTCAVGDYYEERLRSLRDSYPRLLRAIEGKRHLAGICFYDVESGKIFAKRLNELGLDISVQTYKSDTPPSALTKLPLIAGYETVDYVLERMDSVLKHI